MGDEHYMRSQKLEKVGDGVLSAMVFVGDLGNWQSGRWIIILRATGIVDTLPISHITHHSHEPACEDLRRSPLSVCVCVQSVKTTDFVAKTTFFLAKTTDFWRRRRIFLFFFVFAKNPSSSPMFTLHTNE